MKHWRQGLALTVGVLATALVVSSCSSGDDDKTTPGGSSAVAIPTNDVVSGIGVDQKARAILPADVQSSNQLILGTTDNQVVGTRSLPHGGITGDNKLVGLDYDIRDAVGKALGITWKAENGTFATIIPGVQNGKYQVGQANFGVTVDRTKVVDFAVYLNDGQAFVGRKDLDINTVTKVTDLCGYKIGTGAGTTFQKLLESSKAECEKLGKKPYSVQYFSGDNGPILLGLQSGKLDAFFGPTLSQKTLAQSVPGLKFLGETNQTPVGFVTAKGSPIAPAIIAAINGLIADGTYKKIFDKWGVADDIITKSELNPTPNF